MIFGARVSATGQPSPLLADRIRTGIELYQSGFVPLLVMSGGRRERRVQRGTAIHPALTRDVLEVSLKLQRRAVTVVGDRRLSRVAGRIDEDHRGIDPAATATSRMSQISKLGA